MSRPRKKHLPATGPRDVTAQPQGRPALSALVPDVTRPGVTRPGGPPALVPWWAVLGAMLAGGLVLTLVLVRDDPVAPKGGSARPGAKVETKGKRWEEVLADIARGGHLGQKPKWVPEKWVPAGEADMVIDRFVTLKKAGDPRADELLGGKALVEDEVITEAELEPRATDTYLRGPFKVEAIYQGEPDGQGGQKAAAGRYTLAGQGPVQTPPIRVREGKSEPLLSRAFITRQGELVVEVRDGKIFGVRSTSGR